MSSQRWINTPATNKNLKRAPSAQDDNDDDDDISLVSRSPSPTNAMDVDTESLSKYDEYVRGNAHEVITVETKIKSSNKGFTMLAKQGWTEGQPLGLYGDGRVDPVPFQIKRDLTGLGKISQDVRMIETTVSQRRELDSERQRKETEYQRKAREDTVARQQALRSELSTTLAAFYCTICSKQFQNVAQYDEHTNSYAHHHKARMKDMATNAKGGAADASAAEERKEKERKREEKELRRAAKAAGVKMAKPVASTGLTPVVATNEGDPKPSAFKKSGWATVSSTSPPSAAPLPASSSKGGWASVGSSSDTRPSGVSSSIPSSAPQPPPPAQPTSRNMGSAPAFRTAGWSSLDTGSSQLPAPPGPPSSFTQPPPPTSAPPPPPASRQPPRAPPNEPNQSGQWGAVSQVRQPQPPSGPLFYDQPPPVPPNPQASVHHFRPGTGRPPEPSNSSQRPNPPPVRTGWQQWSSNSSASKRR